MPLSVTIAGKQSLVVTPIGATVPVAIIGNEIINPKSAFFKAILFSRTGTSEADFIDLVGILNSNVDAIMASIDWGNTFYWNFDIKPTLNISDGSMTGFNGNVNYSACEQPGIPFNGGSTNLVYDDIAFLNTEHFCSSRNVADVTDPPGGGPGYPQQCRSSWALMKGDAQVKNNYTEIVDHAILTPGDYPRPPNSIDFIPPTVYDNPSYATPTVYKIAIPSRGTFRITEANVFTLL